ncbi:cyclic nucleotide-gated channel rod photoreceptor subunit alpha-like [Antedon mediterranea]|uniref:cyclic nucleotide-gated channel rod photoreceptor subunit alpha-like n=1 Tax=Antedon mediterranea TaxID=105859 RepID=UPI003AF945DF
MASLSTPIVSNNNSTVKSLTELPSENVDLPRRRSSLVKQLNGRIHPLTEPDSAGEMVSMECSGRSSAKTSSTTHLVEPDCGSVASSCQTPRQKSGLTRWSTLRTVIRVARPPKRKKPKVSTQRVDSFLEKFTTRQREGADEDISNYSTCECETDDVDELSWNFIAHPDGNFSFYWLFIVTIAVLYNLWMMIAREAWPEIQENSLAIWFTVDYLCDLVYVIDIVVQLRTGYLEQGLLQRNELKLRNHYLYSWKFPVDLVSLTPLDFLYLIEADQFHTMVRFPRFFKVYRARMWYYMLETRAPYPNFLRVADLTHIILMLIHWAAAAYYLFSKAIGFGEEGAWVYPTPEGEYSSTLRKYVMSVFWSTLTLTTIGDIPFPESNSEYAVQIVGYLIGVFVFASVVGQVGTVIENRNAERIAFEGQLDNAKRYMRTNNVPTEVQTRVRRWFDYTWSSGNVRGEGDVNSLSLLPAKLRTELALHVNLKTLKKVTMFNACPPEFLHELVLKMPSTIFTPGDLICRKGEVAREMFIISDGYLEVMGDGGSVLTTLKAGDFFGEIGILNIEGVSNRRTADVRSVGYSVLFTLTKEDVLAALQYYPQAQTVLEEEGRKRLMGRRVTPKHSEPLVDEKPIVIEDVSDISRDSSLERTTTHSAPGSLTDVTSSKTMKSSRKLLKPVKEVYPRKRRVAHTEHTLTNEVMEMIQVAVQDKLETVGTENKKLTKHSKRLAAKVAELETQKEIHEVEIERLNQKIRDLERRRSPVQKVKESDMLLPQAASTEVKEEETVNNTTPIVETTTRPQITETKPDETETLFI